MNRLRNTLIVLLSITGIISFWFIFNPSKEEINEPKPFVLMEDTYQPKHTAAELAVRLENAYLTKDKEAMAQFFEEWHTSIPPNPPEFENQLPIIKDVYDIYRALFITENTEHIKHYPSCPYLIVPSTMSYCPEEFIELEDGTFAIAYPEEKLIPYFRPAIDVEGKKILYLTDEYSDALLVFLKNSNDKVQPLSSSDDDWYKRMTLIQQYAPIKLSEGMYWILHSPPYAGGFYFETPSPDSLRIGYRIGYYGYDATAKRTPNGWVIENRKTTYVI